MPITLNQIGLRHYFDATSDGNNILKSKPYLEVFLNVAQMLCIKSELCMIVEDSDAGIEAERKLV